MPRKGPVGWRMVPSYLYGLTMPSTYSEEYRDKRAHKTVANDGVYGVYIARSRYILIAKQLCQREVARGGYSVPP